MIGGIKGLYMGSDGEADTDTITLVYTDMPFEFDANLDLLSDYADSLREAVLEASSEESVLVVIHEIYHSL